MKSCLGLGLGLGQLNLGLGLGQAWFTKSWSRSCLGIPNKVLVLEV